MKPLPPLLLVSYGAPERQEDVAPFLNNLFAGKNVSAERKAAAVQKYERFAANAGHYSPLNSECRKLIEGIWYIEPNVPIYWGNLFGHPLLVDTIAEMARDGVERALCFATSVFDSDRKSVV
jgi:ferrochelatase